MPQNCGLLCKPNVHREFAQERMAEGGGLEPPLPYRVDGLAIRCITTLPSLRGRGFSGGGARPVNRGGW